MADKATTKPASAVSPTTSRIEAGPTEETPHAEQVDAINQVFALFRVNYHNQYYAAFSDTELLNQTKKLWLQSLSRFSTRAILEGARRAIESCEYLPTLHKMIICCQGEPARHGLPDTHRAYREACHAPSPKAAHDWSHPAVYFAGRDTDWHFLASSPERVAFPRFREQYQRWCEKVMAGESLPAIRAPRLEDETSTPLSREENRDRLQAMRRKLKL